MIASRRIELKTPEQIKLMRRAGLVVHRALSVVSAEARAGMTTGELDAIADEVIRSAGATPSFRDYGQLPRQPGFPAVCCISVNDEVVHGIPGDRTLLAGDLVSIDCGAIVDGWHGDAAVTVLIDTPQAELVLLSDHTRGALWAGVAAMRAGAHIGDISAAIQAEVTRHNRYSIISGYTGHGIGSALHQSPDVPNRGKAGRGAKIVPGMCLAIEPMVGLGTSQTTTLDDDWTVVTNDRSVACHWEHTVAITQRGLWVLTADDGGEAMLAERGLAAAPLGD